MDTEKKVYKLSTQMQRFIEIIRPDRRCQVCRSDQTEVTTDKGDHDRLIQCSLCLSTIHQTHYGSELITSTPLQWHCQRCTYLLKLNDPEINSISCQYCPSRSGIMKQIEYEKKKYWIHPECVIWDFPARFFHNKSFETVRKTNKLQSPPELFWFREFPNRRCKVCNSSEGQFVRCRYYSCETHFHVTCGRTIGVIRELQKMRIFNSDCYIPVYCIDHLELRVKDFKDKADKEKNKQKHKKLLDFFELYQQQVNNLKKAKHYEDTLHTKYVLEFVYEQDSKSAYPESQSQSMMVVQHQPTQYDESLCEYLQKELDGCLINPNPNAFKVVAEIPMEIQKKPEELVQGQQESERNQNSEFEQIPKESENRDQSIEVQRPLEGEHQSPQQFISKQHCIEPKSQQEEKYEIIQEMMIEEQPQDIKIDEQLQLNEQTVLAKEPEPEPIQQQQNPQLH